MLKKRKLINAFQVYYCFQKMSWGIKYNTDDVELEIDILQYIVLQDLRNVNNLG